MAIKIHSYCSFTYKFAIDLFFHRMGVPCDMATFDFGQPSSTASLIGTGTPKRLFNFGPSSSSLPRSLRQPPGNTNKALFFKKVSVNLQTYSSFFLARVSKSFKSTFLSSFFFLLLPTWIKYWRYVIYTI